MTAARSPNSPSAEGGHPTDIDSVFLRRTTVLCDARRRKLQSPRAQAGRPRRGRRWRFIREDEFRRICGEQPQILPAMDRGRREFRRICLTNNEYEMQLLAR